MKITSNILSLPRKTKTTRNGKYFYNIHREKAHYEYYRTFPGYFPSSAYDY